MPIQGRKKSCTITKEDVFVAVFVAVTEQDRKTFDVKLFIPKSNLLNASDASIRYKNRHNVSEAENHDETSNHDEVPAASDPTAEASDPPAEASQDKDASSQDKDEMIDPEKAAEDNDWPPISMHLSITVHIYTLTIKN